MSSHQIGKWQLVMLVVACIVNISGLSVLCSSGYFFIILLLCSVMLFFIPSVFVSAELAATWPSSGGMYDWTKSAFSKQQAFMASFVLAFAFIILTATFMGFSSGVLAYAIGKPELANSATFTFLCTMIAIWLSFAINWFGIKSSARMAFTSAILGYFFPILALTIFAIIWLFTGHESTAPLNMQNFLPQSSFIANFGLLGVMILLISGAELCGYFISHVKDKKQFSSAMVIIVILLTIAPLLCVISIITFVPIQGINGKNALMDAFVIFGKEEHIMWLIRLIFILLFIGQSLTVCMIVLAGAKVLWPACNDGLLPKWLAVQNKHKAPHRLLFLVAFIATLVATIYIFIPSLTTAFEILFMILAITATCRYFWVFGAGIKLRYKYPDIPRKLKVPGGNIGMWTISGIGLISIVFAIVVSFIPVPDIKMNIVKYESIIIIGSLIVLLTPLLISFLRSKIRG